MFKYSLKISLHHIFLKNVGLIQLFKKKSIQIESMKKK